MIHSLVFYSITDSFTVANLGAFVFNKCYFKSRSLRPKESNWLISSL